MPLIESSILSVIPYIDYNILFGNADPRAGLPGLLNLPQVDSGQGLHIGTNVGFRFPILLDISLAAKLEYRRLGTRYLPAYFDQTYDLQRYQYPLAADSTRCAALQGNFDPKQQTCNLPKAAAVGQITDSKNGIYGEVAFKFMNLVTVGGGVEDYEGPLNGAINLYGTMPALKDFLVVTAFYTRRAIDITQDAFGLDEKSLLGATGKIKIMSPGLYLVAMFTRQWANDPNQGRIVNIDNFNIGVEFNLGM
jgi:hypothetical protein